MYPIAGINDIYGFLMCEQMHIHVAKLNPTLRKSLNTAAWGTKPFSTWIDIPNPVGHKVLRAKFVPVSRIIEPVMPCLDRTCREMQADANNPSHPSQIFR